MDITSPALLKMKASLFLLIAGIASGLLACSVYSVLSWQVGVLYVLSIWASCRAYYFCFYVMEHYADPHFKYTGLLDLVLFLTGLKQRPVAASSEQDDEQNFGPLSK